MYESELIIAVRNGNGEIIASQTFEEFMNGRKNIEILNYYTGQKLFDILFDDLGIIRYEDNVADFLAVLGFDELEQFAFLIKQLLGDYEITKEDVEKMRRLIKNGYLLLEEKKLKAKQQSVFRRWVLGL